MLSEEAQKIENTSFLRCKKIKRGLFEGIFSVSGTSWSFHSVFWNVVKDVVRILTHCKRFEHKNGSSYFF